MLSKRHVYRKTVLLIILIITFVQGYHCFKKYLAITIYQWAFKLPNAFEKACLQEDYFINNLINSIWIGASLFQKIVNNNNLSVTFWTSKCFRKRHVYRKTYFPWSFPSLPCWSILLYRLKIGTCIFHSDVTIEVCVVYPGN